LASGRKSVCACRRKPSHEVNEKLTQLCQSGESIGKLKPATPKSPVNPVA
jgi:hypothetical protein